MLMYIPVTFEPSQGQLAMVIYEWSDVKYLGKITTSDDTLPVSDCNGLKLHVLFLLKQYIAENVCMHHKCRDWGVL
jgi:hypothetical protein